MSNKENLTDTERARKHMHDSIVEEQLNTIAKEILDFLLRNNFTQFSAEQIKEMLTQKTTLKCPVPINAGLFGLHFKKMECNLTGYIRIVEDKSGKTHVADPLVIGEFSVRHNYDTFSGGNGISTTFMAVPVSYNSYTIVRSPDVSKLWNYRDRLECRKKK